MNRREKNMDWLALSPFSVSALRRMQTNRGKRKEILLMRSRRQRGCARLTIVKVRFGVRTSKRIEEKLLNMSNVNLCPYIEEEEESLTINFPEFPPNYDSFHLVFALFFFFSASPALPFAPRHRFPIRGDRIFCILISGLDFPSKESKLIKCANLEFREESEQRTLRPTHLRYPNEA